MSLPLAVRPLLDPLPLWDYWPWLLLPLVVGVSVVYKSIKCRNMREVPKEAAIIAFWMLFGIVAAGAVLWGLVAFASRG